MILRFNIKVHFFSFKTIVLVSQSGERFHPNQYVVHAKSLHLYKISPQSTGTQGSKPVTLQLAARHWWEFVSSCQVINYKSKPSTIPMIDQCIPYSVLLGCFKNYQITRHIATNTLTHSHTHTHTFTYSRSNS